MPMKPFAGILAASAALRRRARPGSERQDRRAERHVEPLRRPRRSGLGCRRQDGGRGFPEGSSEREGRDRLRRSSEQAGRRNADREPVVRCRQGRHDHRRAELRRRARGQPGRGQKNKLFIVSGAAASDLTGPKCNANTVHWTYDTWMLANGTGKAMVKIGRRHLVLPHRRLCLRPCARARYDRRGRRGERRQGARQGARIR